jgi:hypothetical protein
MRREILFLVVLIIVPILLQVPVFTPYACSAAVVWSENLDDGIDKRRMGRSGIFRVEEYLIVIGVDKISLWPWDLEFVEDIISVTCERGGDFVTIQVSVRNNGVSPSFAGVDWGVIPQGIDPNLRQLQIGVDPNSTNNIAVEFRALNSCSPGFYIVEFHLVNAETPTREIVDTMQFHITVPGIPFTPFSAGPIEVLIIGFALQGILIAVVLRLESYIRKRKRPI